jgi:hypothetical protein
MISWSIDRSRDALVYSDPEGKIMGGPSAWLKRSGGRSTGSG